MELTTQRRLAASVLHCSPKRVWFDQTHLGDIKESITKADMRGLVIKGYVQLKTAGRNSRGRIRAVLRQRRKGRQAGHGSRGGTANARASEKRAWINRVRRQRVFLKQLIGKYIDAPTYRMLYRKSKGGYFRSERHIKLYLDEHKLSKRKVTEQ